jgi:hypothetical protein
MTLRIIQQAAATVSTLEIYGDEEKQSTAHLPPRVLNPVPERHWCDLCARYAAKLLN